MTFIEQLKHAVETLETLQFEADRSTPAGSVMWMKLEEAKHVLDTRIIIEQELMK